MSDRERSGLDDPIAVGLCSDGRKDDEQSHLLRVHIVSHRQAKGYQYFGWDVDLAVRTDPPQQFRGGCHGQYVVELRRTMSWITITLVAG